MYLTLLTSSNLYFLWNEFAGTTFDIRAKAASWCNSQYNVCEKVFVATDSVDKVREGTGDLYFFDGEHLYFRIVQQSSSR